ncbi:DNA glycosylase [Obba rivulosa]|uniref:DNA glycosylase n=1 Tax=Obba rivulosa TaxID=1052685 RepID=A0A8E2AK15_9APHY|nr:DNA glycosylase [Obba rivulosa]
MSAEVGHHFANPTNHFWRCLFGSGLTDHLLPPTEDYSLPEKYNLGLTNLVERPSAQEAELANSEFAGGVPVLLQKIARYRPRVVCFIGKGIWAEFQPTTMRRKVTKTRAPDFAYGIQPYKIVHRVKETSVKETLFFVMPSTSGRVVSHQLPQKTALMKTLGERVEDLKQGTFNTASMTVIAVPE